MPLDSSLSDHDSEHSCNSFREDGVSGHDGGIDYDVDNSDYTSGDAYTDSDSGMYNHKLHFRIIWCPVTYNYKQRIYLALSSCVYTIYVGSPQV